MKKLGLRKHKWKACPECWLFGGWIGLLSIHSLRKGGRRGMISAYVSAKFFHSAFTKTPELHITTQKALEIAVLPHTNLPRSMTS